MELYFLGRGGAFFTEEGNTSAFFIEHRKLFLIDCGESVFKKVKETHLLEFTHVDEVYVFITHMHTDHTGSLGSFVYYCAFNDFGKKIKCHVVCAPAIQDDLFENLRPTGCLPCFDFKRVEDLAGKFHCFTSVRFIRTLHQKGYPAFSIEFETPTGLVFYSGDTRDLQMIESYIGQANKIEKLYIETISEEFPNNVHLPIDWLDNAIPAELRSKTYLMHFNNYACIEKAKKLGFQVVEVIG